MPKRRYPRVSRKRRRSHQDELSGVPTNTQNPVSHQDNILHLQQTLGNQAVSRMVQGAPKGKAIQRSVSDLIKYWESQGGGNKEDTGGGAPNTGTYVDSLDDLGGGSGMYGNDPNMMGDGGMYANNPNGNYVDNLDDLGGGGGMYGNDPNMMGNGGMYANNPNGNYVDNLDDLGGGSGMYGNDPNMMGGGQYATSIDDLGSGGFYANNPNGGGGQYATQIVFDDYDESEIDWSEDESDDFDLDDEDEEETKYSENKPLLGGHEHESDDSTAFTEMLIKNSLQIVLGKAKQLFISKGWLDLGAGTINWYPVMRAHMGWSKETVDKYMGDQLTDGFGPMDIKLNTKTKVEYLDADERKKYELTGGSTLMQNDEAFDTGEMYSKFKGAGFGIYVMSPNGELYSNAHQVGLFHHSSFLSGLDVAGAGEMQVAGGQLKHITNKSGHYWPGVEQMLQTLYELRDRGVSLSGVGMTLLPDGEVVDDAVEWLEDHEDEVDDPNREDADDSYDDEDDGYMFMQNDSGYMVKVKKEEAPSDSEYATFIPSSGGYLMPTQSNETSLYFAHDDGRLMPVDDIDDSEPSSKYYVMQPSGMMLPYGVSIGYVDSIDDMGAGEEDTPAGQSTYFVMNSEGYLETLD